MTYVPLFEAARRLGVSFWRALALVKCGALVGRYDPRNRVWFVNEDSIRAYRRARGQAA